MSALAVAAHNVQNAWCKGSMRKEEQSRAVGDTYCAAGALAASLLKPGQMLTLDGEYYGPSEVVQQLDLLAFKEFEGYPEDYQEKIRLNRELEGNTGLLIDEDPRAQMLARVIIESRSELYGNWSSEDISYEVENNASEVIINFNDDDDTTREDVVAAMLEADRRYEAANG